MDFDLQKYLDEVQRALVCRIIVEGFDMDDRLYHAADRTWWRWDGQNWKASEPPGGWTHSQNAQDKRP